MSARKSTCTNPAHNRLDFSAEVYLTTTCAAIHRRNTTPRSTSRSPERDAFLVLVGSGATLVGLRGGRLEGHEDDLGEPLSDRQLKGLGRRVEGAEGERPGERRVDDPERCDAAPA